MTRMEEYRDRRRADPVGQGRSAAAAGTAAAGVRARDRRRKARRRRQINRRDRQADRGRSDLPTRAERRTARNGAVGAGRYPSADRDRPAAQPLQPGGQSAARHRCPTRRRSAAAPSSIRASSGRAAGTGSSPMSRSRSRHCRAARVSPLPTRSSAARSRATTSRRSRKVSSRRLRAARSASRWSISTVNLITGQFHAVDSSDQAFNTAGRQAIQEAMPKCEPILLEPIDSVEISVPNAFTARVQRLVSGRRGQILGYDAKAGLARLGRGQRAHAAERIARSDRRVALADPRRRQLCPCASTTCRN